MNGSPARRFSRAALAKGRPLCAAAACWKREPRYARGCTRLGLAGESTPPPLRGLAERTLRSEGCAGVLGTSDNPLG